MPSVTMTTTGNVPPCVGVPESTPFVPSVSPAGSVLAVVNVAPPIAPVCVNVSENGDPAATVALAGLVTVIVWQPITSVYVALVPVQLFESVTVTTIGNEPDCSGVPLSTPPVESVMPAGSVLAVVNVAVPMAHSA